MKGEAEGNLCCTAVPNLIPEICPEQGSASLKLGGRQRNGRSHHTSHIVVSLSHG